MEAPGSKHEWRQILAIASIAAGIQFGWALQLSLLTPYVQLLGVPHMWSTFIWLCGPISGLLVQPIVGYYSDRSTSRFGRRRPFIAAGAVAVAIAVFLIGYAADFGHSLGDPLQAKVRPRAVVFFVVGFWVLDVANNMLQGPCRAFLADMAAGDPKKTRTGQALFSFFMAVGNVLGYAAGSYGGLYHLFPFTRTEACGVSCANLKSCFFFSIALLLVLTVTALTYVKEKTVSSEEKEVDNQEKGNESASCFSGSLCGACRGLNKPMWILLLVTCMNWVAWFPFFLFDTDWFGREVYGGEVGKGSMYEMGVRAGALGLMVQSVVLAMASLAVEPAARLVGGPNRLWGIVNFLLAVCLAMTVLITKAAEHSRQYTTGPDGVVQPLPPTDEVKGAALALFAVLAIPMAVTYSIPFALASIFSSSSGAGQGLSLGVLNLSIVIPQMFVSVISGPWDALFGGGNLPAFVLGAVMAAISGILAMTVLPSPPSDAKTKLTSSGSFH